MVRWLLEAVMRNLIVEDELRPATTIVVLEGGHPHREVGAAALYRRGLASRLMLVRSYWSQQASDRLRALGVIAPDDGHLRRQLLRALRVPDSAILTPDGLARATKDELTLALEALPDDGPVILVTSTYHTRRVRLCWQRLTDGRPAAMIHGVTEPHLQLDQWWRNEPVVLSVAQEYYGLARQLIAPTPMPRERREEMGRVLRGALEELEAADEIGARR